MPEDRPAVLVDEREVVDETYVKRIRVLAVPRSEKFPEGVKYRMHFGTIDGETILRFDNSHGRHERHAGDAVAEIDFPGIEPLYRRFIRNVQNRNQPR